MYLVMIADPGRRSKSSEAVCDRERICDEKLSNVADDDDDESDMAAGPR